MAFFHLSCSGCCGNEDVNIFTELPWMVSQDEQSTTPGGVIHIDCNMNEDPRPPFSHHNLGSPRSRPRDKDWKWEFIWEVEKTIGQESEEVKPGRKKANKASSERLELNSMGKLGNSSNYMSQNYPSRGVRKLWYLYTNQLLRRVIHWTRAIMVIMVGVEVLIPWQLFLLEAKVGAFCDSGMWRGVEKRSLQGKNSDLRMEVIHSQSTAEALTWQNLLESPTIS